MTIELISVHVPKTAGTSFEKIIRRYYGRKILLLYESNWIDSDKYYLNLVKNDDRSRVICGHFRFTLFRELYPDAKATIWMRDPVERVISYYYYWARRENHGNPYHDRFLLENWTILELAHLLKGEVNEIILGGKYRISDFDFVGIVEKADVDFPRFESWLGNVRKRTFIEDIADKLRWSWAREFRRTIPKQNTGFNKEEVSESLRKEIADIMRSEIDLYEEALSIRSKSLKS